MHTTKREIKLKNGTVFAKGSTFTITFDKDKACAVNIHINGESFKTRTTNLPRISDDFYLPSMDELEEMSCDGIYDSVMGESVEPDGWDCHGSPSWLLAYGLI